MNRKFARYGIVAAVAMAAWAWTGTVAAGAGCAACAGCAAQARAAAGTARAEAGAAEKAEEPEITRQTVCPVMGGPIDRDLYVDHEGKRIYVCCAGCIEPVKADPAQHVETMEAEGITLYRVQTHCPVMTRQRIQRGRSRHVDHEGRRIYVCCGSCHRAVSGDPARYVEALTEAGVGLDKAE